jgi:hypothetical protein
MRKVISTSRIAQVKAHTIHLDKLDRYERRALSCRNKAIKAFDEAWAAADYGSADCLTPFWQNEPMEDANTHQGQPTEP